MTILKSEQILADSTKSFEDAVQNAVSRFSKTVRGVKLAHVNSQSVTVEGGKVTSYRVNLQITFEVEDMPSKSEAKADAKVKPAKKG
jgi:flavin-binding protein dodecin